MDDFPEVDNGGVEGGVAAVVGGGALEGGGGDVRVSFDEGFELGGGEEGEGFAGEEGVEAAVESGVGGGDGGVC